MVMLVYTGVASYSNDAGNGMQYQNIQISISLVHHHEPPRRVCQNDARAAVLLSSLAASSRIALKPHYRSFSMSNNSTSTPPPPSTPTTAPSNTTVPPASTRRSARVHKRDPIILPGFGTQQDLDTLAKDLGQPVAVVQAVMASKGRGYRRRGQADDTAAAAAAPVNTSWADFLSEESPAAPSKMAADESSTAAAASSEAADDDDESTTRTYVLPLAPEWLKKGPSQAKKAKKGSSVGSGILVQAGTLDATCIGRTKPTMDRSFDLPVPSVLLPRIQFTKVISSCNAAHALAIDTAGNVYGWGRNEADQLGAGLGSSYVGKPFLLEGLDSNIVGGAVGKFHSMVLDADQQLWAVGGNKAGQCGIKSSIDAVPNFRKCVMDANVVQVSFYVVIAAFCWIL
jgi:hypothetical protein